MVKQTDIRRNGGSEVMKTKYKVVALSIVFGLFVWVIDAVLDYFIFYQGPFWELLITGIPKHEIYIRSVILASFIVFGILMSAAIGRRKRTEEALRASNQQLQASEQQFKAASQQLKASQAELQALKQKKL